MTWWQLPVVIFVTTALALEVPSFLGPEAMESTGDSPVATAGIPAPLPEPVITYENVVSEVLSEPDAIGTHVVDCVAEPCVALTLDDGPGLHTPEVLDILSEFDARATFYLVGDQVAAWPGRLDMIVEAGHDVGNHTLSHPRLSELTLTERRNEIVRFDHMVFLQVGVTPTTLRPPFGDLPDTPLPDGLNRPVVMWSVDSLDWKKRTTAAIVDEVLADIGAGDIILMHELYRRSVDALPLILAELNDRGLRVVSVADLLGPQLYSPGEITHVPFDCRLFEPDVQAPQWCVENPDWVRTGD